MNTARTPLFYMANLGAEVARLCADRKRNPADVQASLARCLHILDEYERVDSSPIRAREIGTLRRVLVDFGGGQKHYAVTAEQLEGYFRPFAMRLLSQ